LLGSEEREAVWVVVGKEIDGGGGAQSTFGGGREGGEFVFGHGRFGGAGFGRGIKLQDLSNTRGSGGSGWTVGRSQESLGKREPKLKRKAGKRSETRVDGKGMNSGSKSKVGEAGRALGEVGGDGVRDEGAEIIAETERFEMVDGEKSGADGLANGGGFQSSVVRATGNVAKCGNEFGRTVKSGVFEQQISKKIEAAGLEIGSSMNSRGRGHKKFDGIRGATEDKAGEGSRR
jgi:hypothetical protein